MKNLKQKFKKNFSVLLSVAIVFSNLNVHAITTQDPVTSNLEENNTIETNITEEFETVESEILDLETNETLETESIEMESTETKTEYVESETSTMYEASEPETVVEVSNLDEFSEEVSFLTSNDSLETDNTYVSKRLLVTSNTEFDTFGAESTLCFGNLYVLTYETENATKTAYQNLSANNDIISVEVDSVIETSSLTSSDRTITTETTQQNDVNSSVVVAVIDSGIDASNSLFENRIIDLGINLSSSGEQNSIKDDNGHGTAVASVIAKNSNTTLLPIKIANSDGKGTVLSLYLAIQTAIENDVDIINLSLTTAPNSDLLTSIIEEANEKGILVVAAAGNQSANVENYTPANIDSVITVAATDQDYYPASYTNYGDLIDYAAIGTDVEVEGLNGTTTMTGTSLSAAYVTAIIANTLNSNEEFSNYVYSNGENIYYGKGIVSTKNIDVPIIDTDYPNTENETPIADDSINLEATTTVTLEGVKYTISNNSTLTITGKGTITNAWQDKLVKSNYYYFGEIEQIVINDDNLTACDANAFTLRSDLVGKLTRKDGTAATGMTDLYKVTITKYNKSGSYAWNSDAFKGNKTVSSITLSSSMKSIKEGCFSEMSSLNTVTFSALTEIPKDAFKNDYVLSSVSGLDKTTVTSIGESAFEHTALMNVTLGKNITSIGDKAFKQCGSLQEVIINTTSLLSSIGEETFAYCGKLSTISTDKDVISYLPTSLSSIGKDAFKMCSSLTRLRITNTSCSIYDSKNTIPSSTMIVGYETERTGTSTAKTYAEKYNHYYYWHGEEIKFKYKNAAQTFTSNIDGIYQIECYGAAGGNSSTGTGSADNTSSGTGSVGSYARVKISLEKNDTLYVYTGGKGGTAASRTSAGAEGWNGGGAGTTGTMNKLSGCKSYSMASGGGGGATDVRTAIGNTGITPSTDTRIIVAGGGAGGGKSGYHINRDGVYSEGGHNYAGGSSASSNNKKRTGSTGTSGFSNDNSGYDQPRLDITGGGGGGYYGGKTVYTGNMKCAAYKGTSYTASGDITVTNGTSTRTASIIADSGVKTVGGGSSGNGSCVFTVEELAHYEINYHSNHSGDEDFVHSDWFKEGESLSIIDCPTELEAFASPKDCDKNCEFLGWNTKADGSGTTYTIGSSYSQLADLDLYAQWSGESTASTLVVNPNGGTWNGNTTTQSFTQVYNTTINIPLPTRTGYTFTGWNRTNTYGTLSSTTSNATYTFGSTSGVTDTITANWSINTFIITYEGNGSTSGTTASQTKNYGESVNISSNGFTRTGYTFTGWNTKTDGTGTSYTVGTAYSTNANLTLYAQWKINTYTITYNGNGATSGTTASQTKNYGTSVNISSNGFVRPGYTFTGWNTKADGSGAPYTVGTAYSANANLTLYAQWERITTTINGNIIWEDWNNKNSSRPSEVTLHIYGSDGSTYNYQISGDNSANTTVNSWSYSKEVPKYDENGDVITYTVGQDKAISKETGIAYKEPIVNEYNITNIASTKEGVVPKINITTYIKWNDNNNHYGFRPNEITIQLLQNGTVIKEATTSETSYVFKNLYKYDENGNLYKYTISSNDVDRYNKSIDNDSNIYEKDITYEFINPTFSVTIPKTVVLDGKTGIGEYTVSVQGNIDDRDSVNVVPNNSFTMGNKYLSPITATVKQTITSFTNKNNIKDGTTATGTITTNSLAGEWSGNFNFKIYFEFGN